MSATAVPYFHDEALRRRFAKDIDEAVDAARISIGVGEWLSALVKREQTTEIMPRVDRLLIDGQAPVSAELAGALIISDTTLFDGSVYLSTVLCGIEKYDTRSALLAALQEQFPEASAPGIEIDLEQVEESDWSSRRMQSILEQQVAHLDDLAQVLLGLPTLQSAVGQALQDQINKLETAPVDVFNRWVQVVSPRRSDNNGSVTTVLKTQTLAETAYQRYVGQTIEDGLTWQFLDDHGAVLDRVRSARYLEALDSAGHQVAAAYERLLSNYWASPDASGRTMKEAGANALADVFRQSLLKNRPGRELGQPACPLRQLLPQPGAREATSGLRMESILVSVEGQPSIRLAGLVLIECAGHEAADLYMFSATYGLVRFADRQKLKEFLTDERRRSALLSHVAVAQQALFDTPSVALTLSFQTLSEPVFATLMDAVIALQTDNLRHALALPTIGHDQASVRADDALDIRTLLDYRLSVMTGSPRWYSDGTDFRKRWGAVKRLDSRNSDDTGLVFETWADQVDRLEALTVQVADLHPGADAFIAHELNRYLAAVGERGLDARSLWVGHGDGYPVRRLSSVVLEAVTGIVKLTMSQEWIVQRSTAGRYLPLSALPVNLTLQIVRRVVKDFPIRYAEWLRTFRTAAVRCADSQLSPAAVARRVREQALRLEVAIARRLNKVGVSALDTLEQVLDSPGTSLRSTSGGIRVRISAIAVGLGAQQEVIRLRNAFMVTRPDQPERFLMWAAGLSFGDLTTQAAVESSLMAQLAYQGPDDVLRDLVSDPDRKRLDDYLESTTAPVMRVVLSDIDGDLIDALQADETQRQVQNAIDAYQDGAAWGLRSDDFINMLAICERDDVNRRLLSNLRNAIQNIVSMTIIPQWIREASDQDQARLWQAMQRFYVACALNEGLLFDIPSLHRYSRQRVLDRLRIDFPQLELDPDAVNVTLTRYVPAPVATGSLPQSIPAATESVTESLSDFAANRFYSAQQGALLINAADGSASPPELTPSYISQLVATLNVAQDYLALLDTAFAEDSPDYAKRRKLFARQLPALEVLTALTLHLQGELSEDACRLIGSIMEMPDGLARLTIKGQYATISPLLLKPDDTSRKATPVLGTYVIAPRDQATGPWILYSLAGDFEFKEYVDQAALLQDIRTSSTLQTYLLERIDEQERSIYAHGGFLEPHLPFSTESSFDVPLSRPAPVTLEIAPYEGNALELLFKDMLSCYRWSVRQVLVTNDQAQRNATRYLLGLAFQQGLAFLPGRLGALVGVWQSGDLLNASASAAGERKWGKALSEFIAAVGALISTRQATRLKSPLNADEAGKSEGFENPDDLEASANSPDFATDLEFTWRNSGMTLELRNRLRAFEAHDVALNGLDKDELTSTYTDSGGRTYVAISGSVYEISQDQNQWYIVTDDRWGPAVKLDGNQRWQLDFGGLKGGGVVGSRLRGSAIDHEVDAILMIEARGMRDIRRRSASWSTAIEQGHAQARFYLENCLDNLTLHQPAQGVHPEAKRVIDEFFSLQVPDPALYATVRQAVVRLFQSLTHPSLSPDNSQRFVVGTNRRWHEPASAFTFRNDPQERIFLTEQFLRVPVYRLKSRVVRAGAFSPATHHYAAILLHELTHLVLDTDDIAYVDSTIPYIDLLDDATSYRLTQKNEVKQQQQRTLSYNTDRSRLFRQAEEGVWRDLRHRDGDAKQTILRVTGARTLEEARDIFYADQKKRADLMMSNADSVALLVTLLGRERYNRRR